MSAVQTVWARLVAGGRGEERPMSAVQTGSAQRVGTPADAARSDR